MNALRVCQVSTVVNDMTPERRIVLQLHNEGFTPREIALELGLSVQRIYQQLKKLGLQPNPRRDEQAS